MEEYTGYIRNVRFYNDANNYIVALIDVEQESKPFVMNGYMTSFNDYDKYIFRGSYEMHPKYGKQFKLESYEVILADAVDEIVKYLSSPLFKGIGKVQAQQIVDTLGKQCLQEIKENRHVLDNVRGMNVKKRDTIFDTLTSNDYDAEVMQFFMGHGISLRNLGLIQAVYKEKTLEVLQNNPYQIIDDIDGVGFQTADDLAIKTGGELDSPDRIKAAIIYSIKQGCFSSGSSYQLLSGVVKNFKRVIYHIEEENFYTYLNELIEERKIIEEEDRYYYEEMYDAEMNISSFIQHLLVQQEEIYDEDQVSDQLQKMQTNKNITYAKKQIEAMEYFLRYPCMILTGGPGTGKTTIVKALLQVYRSLYPEDQIGLIAPTGRAAKRLSELTGMQASTIHRLLKWDLHTNTFAMNKENPLTQEVLIIDEFSMVDSILLSKLFEASKRVRKILFIGDYHQLPSVAPGNVLKDLIQTSIKTVELDEIFRQGEDSGIIQLAHQIIHDEVNDVQVFNEYKDINFFPCMNYDVVKNVKMIVKKALQEGYSNNDIQVLAPMYQGVAGIDALNDALQDVFNPDDGYKKTMRIGRKLYRVGDKILQLKNRPEEDVFNGDIGTLLEINKKDNFEYLEDMFIVDYDGILVEYTGKTFSTITHAYCMSIHKSQGNEFKIVILSVLKDYYIMLRRNLLYTGITRAKQSLFLLGEVDAFVRGIGNAHDANRLTTLQQRFDDGIDEPSVYDFME